MAGAKSEAEQEFEFARRGGVQEKAWGAKKFEIIEQAVDSLKGDYDNLHAALGRSQGENVQLRKINWEQAQRLRALATDKSNLLEQIELLKQQVALLKSLPAAPGGPRAAHGQELDFSLGPSL